MTVSQVYQIVNAAAREVLGQDAVIQEDLSNVVDVGNQVLGANAMDAYVKALVNHIGRVIFVNRVYKGSAPSVLMDSWEYGSILEKVHVELPSATSNPTWGLVDGQSYDPNVFHQPIVGAKFYNSKITFEIEMSFTELQVKQSFSNASQLNAFISMIYTAIENKMTVYIDELIMRTINTYIAKTMDNDFGGAPQSTDTSVRGVNLLKLYNDEYGTNLTKSKCLSDKNFIRYAAYVIGLYQDRISKISTLFNIDGKERFTPDDKLHLVLLSDFAKAADVFLQSDTYHNEFTKLPNAETVPYWQGTGTDYNFGSVSKINVKHGTTVVEMDGVLGTMFDSDALGVTNLDRRVTTQYNAKGEFYNNFYKFDAGYFIDDQENFVVFFVA